MAEYIEILDAVGLSTGLRAIATGEIEIPIIGSEQPPGEYGFPPALLPLWTDGPVGYGYWHHWNWRGSSFVRLSRELARVVEIARSDAQLARWVCQAAICFSDEVTPRIRKFAEAIGVDDLPEVDAVTLESGDNPVGLRRLAAFAADLPAACLSEGDSYTGELPIDERHLDRDFLQRICLYELSDGLRSRLAEVENPPAWLVTDSPMSVFERLLGQGDEPGAWLSLNSHGWQFADAAEAILKLAAGHRGTAFESWAELWSREARQAPGGY